MRSYPAQLPAIDYPGPYVVKRITDAGTLRFKDRLFFLSNALDNHHIGLEEVDDGLWFVHFCHLVLARIDERTGTLTRGLRRVLRSSSGSLVDTRFDDGLQDHWTTAPGCSVQRSVTHVAGILCYLCSRSLRFEKPSVMQSLKFGRSEFGARAGVGLPSQ